MKKELHNNIIGGFQLPLHPRRMFSHAVRIDRARRFHGATEMSLNCITIIKMKTTSCMSHAKPGIKKV